MTALRKYDRLESPGLWRATPQAQRRDVVVALCDATLVLSDPRSELALSHWSLPAVTRLNPGEDPALFGPAPDATETLEIDDAQMIGALETVRRALLRRQAKPGRLRGALLGAGLVGVLGLGMLLVPDALIRHTAAVLPAVSRSQIGALAQTDLSRVTGLPCAAGLGQRAAAVLAERLFGPDAMRIEVVRDGVTGALMLPGGVIVLGRGLIEGFPDAEATAGHALAEAVRGAEHDPMIPLLTYAGLPATLRLLTTGALPEDALHGYGEHLLKQSRSDPPTDALIARFRAADLSTRAYAMAGHPDSAVQLVNADPFPNGSPRPVLADEDWVSLQSICTD